MRYYTQAKPIVFDCTLRTDERVRNSMQRIGIAKIGTILIGLSPVAALYWWFSVGIGFLEWYWSYRISYLTFSVLMISLPSLMTTVGLAMYGIRRRAPWQTNNKKRALLLLTGTALVLAGSMLTWYTYAMSVPYNYLAENSPYFVLSGLWIVSGGALLTDAVLGKTEGQTPRSTRSWLDRNSMHTTTCGSARAKTEIEDMSQPSIEKAKV